MTNEEILDELHMKLYDACKVLTLGFIQRGYDDPDQSRTFLLWCASGKYIVKLKASPSTVMDADIILDPKSLGLSVDQVRETIKAKLGIA